MTESFLANWGEHLVIFFAGASGLGLISHAVNTFPVPDNKYAKWIIGTIQYVVGQRTQAMTTMTSHPSTTAPVDSASGGTNSK